MIRILFSLMIVGAFCLPASGQIYTDNVAALTATGTVSTVQEVAEAETSFHRQVILTGRKMAQAGTLKRVDLVKLRVAMLSPAFRQHAENLAVVQMSASGIEAAEAPIGPDGKIDRANIDWEGLAAFIEKLIPLILMLIEAFGGM